MGIVKHKDLFSSKFTTAIIIDENKRGYFVPIKYVLNDLFLVKIQGLIYCFKIVDNRLVTYRETLVKSCHFLIYNTDNYMPLSPNDLSNLENILKLNDLPNKVNRSLLNTFRILGQKETKEFKEHDLPDLIQQISQHEEKYPEEVRQMKDYLQQLGTKKIITPVKKASDFLVDELITSDPQFYGSVVSQHTLVENEHKKVTNTPITGKKPWLKMVVILMMVGMVGGLGYYAYSSGAFDHIVPQIGGGQTTQSSIMAEYPDPVKLKQAISDGKVNYNDLPKDVQKLVDNTKLPPKPLPPNQH